MRRTARVGDLHETALAMPHVTVEIAGGDRRIYQVGSRSEAWLAQASARRGRLWLDQQA